MCDKEQSFSQTKLEFISVDVQDLDSTLNFQKTKDCRLSVAEDVRVDDVSSSKLRPSTEASSLKKAIQKLTSLAGNKKCLQDQISVRTAELPDHSDPESLLKTKKPFYTRSWFVGTIYGLLLLILVAAILALAANRDIIIPNAVLGGETLQSQNYDKDTSGIVRSNIVDSSLLPATPQTKSANSAPSSNAEPTLPQLTSATNTVLPDLVSSA